MKEQLFWLKWSLCMFLFAFVCVFVYVGFLCVFVSVCVFVNVYVLVCSWMCSYVYACICMLACVCVCIVYLPMLLDIMTFSSPEGSTHLDSLCPSNRKLCLAPGLASVIAVNAFQQRVCEVYQAPSVGSRSGQGHSFHLSVNRRHFPPVFSRASACCVAGEGRESMSQTGPFSGQPFQNRCEDVILWDVLGRAWILPFSHPCVLDGPGLSLYECAGGLSISGRTTPELSPGLAVLLRMVWKKKSTSHKHARDLWEARDILFSALSSHSLCGHQFCGKLSLSPKVEEPEWSLWQQLRNISLWTVSCSLKSFGDTKFEESLYFVVYWVKVTTLACARAIAGKLTWLLRATASGPDFVDLKLPTSYVALSKILTPNLSLSSSLLKREWSWFLTPGTLRTINPED